MPDDRRQRLQRGNEPAELLAIDAESHDCPPPLLPQRLRDLRRVECATRGFVARSIEFFDLRLAAILLRRLLTNGPGEQLDQRADFLLTDAGRRREFVEGSVDQVAHRAAQ